MALHKLVFDTTDATTQAASANVGAYVRSSDGTLIDSVTIATVDRLAVDATMKAGDGTDITQTGGALDVNIASGSVTVDFPNDYAEDSAHTTGDTGGFVLAVRQDTLAASTDADGDYAAFKVDSVGSLYTKDTDAAALLTTIDADTGSIATDTAAMVVDLAAIEVELLDQGTTLDGIKTDTAAMVVDLAAIEVELLDQGTTLDSILADTASIDTSTASTATNTGTISTEIQSLSHAEDTAHTTGDAGIQTLAVRNDTLAALADTDGDYAPLQVNADGALYVDVGTISVDDAALANTAIASAANTLGVDNTAEDVVASPLASRKYLFIYNEGNKTAYIGASGVSAATGFPLPPGAILEMRAGASVDIEWVAADTGQEIRTLELS